MKNTKQVLVINPWATDFKLYDEWMHPLGLYFLLAHLQKLNFQISFINCLLTPKEKLKKYSTGPITYKELEKPSLYIDIPRKYKLYGISEDEFDMQMKTKTPDIILIGSAMTYWIDGLKFTIEKVRQYFPTTPIIIGGISATLQPNLLQSIFPDCQIATTSLDTQLAATLQCDPHGNFGIDNLNLSSIQNFCQGHIHAPVITTIGCPQRCTYCASSILQPKFCKRPLDTIIDEINAWKKMGIQNFAFFDDALLIDKEHLFSILNKIILNFPGNNFHTPNGLHLKSIDTTTAELLFQSGFKTLRFGYESGSLKYSKNAENKAPRELFREKIDILKKSGFNGSQIGIYVMGGLPNQKPSDVHEELDFISQFEVLIKPVFLSPVPKTALFDYYVKTYPQIAENPLWQNDLFFITQLPLWSFQAVEEIRFRTRELNAKVLK